VVRTKFSRSHETFETKSVRINILKQMLSAPTRLKHIVVQINLLRTKLLEKDVTTNVDRAKVLLKQRCSITF